MARSRSSSTPLPTSARLKAQLDLLLGVALLAVGLRALLRPPAPKPARRAGRPPGRAWRSFLAGLGAMLGNVTTIALYLPAMKLVAASGVDVAAKCLVAVLVLLLTLGLVLVPLGLAAVAPATSARVLAAVGAWMTRHRRAIQVVLGVGFGCWLTAKGLLAR